MAEMRIGLDEALDLTRTGDVWLFRGRKVADRAIQVTTNSPVNHVGMSVVIDDLPPLLWHAELGRSLPDLWSGRHAVSVGGSAGLAVGVWAGAGRQAGRAGGRVGDRLLRGGRRRHLPGHGAAAWWAPAGLV